MNEPVTIRVEGGPGHGVEYTVPLDQARTLPLRASVNGAIYRFCEDIGDDGFIRWRYVLEESTPVRQRPRRVPYLAIQYLRTPVLYVLEYGGTWRDVVNATGVPYARWLSERKEDPDFDAACSLARQRGRKQ